MSSKSVAFKPLSLESISHPNAFPEDLLPEKAAVGEAAPKKSGIVTPELKEKYEQIAKDSTKRAQKYDAFVQKHNFDQALKVAKELGFELNVAAGQLSYAPSFKPIALCYDVCFVRHGKTEGNTEPRVYQGCVNRALNELTEVGIKQAQDAADKMDQFTGYSQKEPTNGSSDNHWRPDLIVLSPLNRAIKTAEPYIVRHPEIPAIVDRGIAEMAFGDWDNAQVIDIPAESIAHLFYLEQNVLVKSDKPYKTASGKLLEPENFVEVLARVHRALKELESLPVLTEVSPKRRAKVLMYGHSMSGAAISMLLGHGQRCCEKTGALGFDGKHIMPNATPTLLLAKIPEWLA